MKYIVMVSFTFIPVLAMNHLDEELDEAVADGKLQAARQAIRNGANVNAQSSHGITPLMTAVGWSTIEMCKFLLENGADVNMQDRYGKTAVWVAISQWQDQKCSLLINNGLDLNITDKDGETALLFAAHMGNPEIIQTLLSTIPARDQVKILTLRGSIWASLHALPKAQPALPKDIKMLIARSFITKPTTDQLIREQMNRIEKMLAVKNKRGESAYDIAVDRNRPKNAQALNLDDPATRQVIFNQIKANIIHLLYGRLSQSEIDILQRFAPKQQQFEGLSDEELELLLEHRDEEAALSKIAENASGIKDLRKLLIEGAREGMSDEEIYQLGKEMGLFE